jgi:hypothetical protein
MAMNDQSTQRHDIEGKLTIWLIGVWWCGMVYCIVGSRRRLTIIAGSIE